MNTPNEKPLPPDQIGHLTTTAMTHCEVAARALQALGVEAARLGTELQAQCDTLADGFRQSSALMAEGVRSYAEDLRMQAMRVADIRKPNGNGKAPDPVEVKAATAVAAAPEGDR